MILLCDLKQFEEKYQLKYEEQDLPLWNNNVSSSEIAVNNDCDFFILEILFILSDISRQK